MTTVASVPIEELSRPHNVQEIFKGDLKPPPAVMLEAPEHDLGVAPMDVARYVSREFHDLEIQRLWPRVWQYAAWGYDLPNAGDSVVYKIVDRSVVIIRQRDNSLKAFINSCLHRGRELCSGAAKRSQIRCPFHGFTWAISGELSWIPAQWDFPQIDRTDFALPEVRVAEWNGFIFVNFDPNAPDLADYMGRMQSQWQGGGDSWDFTRRYKAVHVEKRIRCNWKVALEAFIENLHVRASHPQFGNTVPETSAQYDIWADEPHFSRFHFLSGFPSSTISQPPSPQDTVDGFIESYFSHLNNSETARLRDGETTRQAFSRISRAVFEGMGLDVSNVPDCELIDGTEYLLFPNFMPFPSLANPFVYRFRPDEGPDTCIWDIMMFLPFVGDRPPSGDIVTVGFDGDLRDVKELGFAGLPFYQDCEQLAPVQRGLKANITGALTLSHYQEARIRHYNGTIDNYLRG